MARTVPPERIVIFGESLGSGVTTNLARKVKASAVILDSPYQSVLARAQAEYVAAGLPDPARHVPQVLLSDCQNHEMLINHLQDFKISSLGLVIGARELQVIIRDKFEQNQDGRLLVAFGELFSQNIRVYVYPAIDEESGQVLTADNLPVPEGIRFLYKYLLDSRQIVSVHTLNSENLSIFPQTVLREIRENNPSWEAHVPRELVKMIREKKFFES